MQELYSHKLSHRTENSRSLFHTPVRWRAVAVSLLRLLTPPPPASPFPAVSQSESHTLPVTGRMLWHLQEAVSWMLLHLKIWIRSTESHSQPRSRQVGGWTWFLYLLVLAHWLPPRPVYPGCYLCGCCAGCGCPCLCCCLQSVRWRPVRGAAVTGRTGLSPKAELQTGPPQPARLENVVTLLIRSGFRHSLSRALLLIGCKRQ